jgi:exosome complex component RRP46
MRTTATAVSLAILPATGSGTQTKILSSFSPQNASAARSTHVFAFSAQGDKLLLAESEGEFTMGEWDEALAAAKKSCCQHEEAVDTSGDGMALDSNGNNDGPDLRGFLRSTVQGKLEDALKWKAAPRE